MVTKKTRIFEISIKGTGFVSKLKGDKEDYDFSDLKLLRNILSNEKGRILHTLKSKKPDSIYQLAKILNRDLKSIRKDVAALHRFGFIDFTSVKTGKRVSHKPELAVETMEFILKL